MTELKKQKARLEELSNNISERLTERKLSSLYLLIGVYHRAKRGVAEQ